MLDKKALNVTITARPNHLRCMNIRASLKFSMAIYHCYIKLTHAEWKYVRDKNRIGFEKIRNIVQFNQQY